MSRRSLRKRGGFTALLVALAAVVSIAAATGGKANAFAWPIPAVDETPRPASSVPRPCALKYAGVLDMAELARRYGKSSQAYRQTFDKVAAQMNDCHAGERYVASSSFPADEGASTESPSYD